MNKPDFISLDFDRWLKERADAFQSTGKLGRQNIRRAIYRRAEAEFLDEDQTGDLINYFYELAL